MALWTVYGNAAAPEREGVLRSAVHGAVSSRISANLLRAGCGVIRDTTGSTAQLVDHPAALAAADPDALVTAAVAISNVAGLQINTIAEFDGVGLGGGMSRIIPARTITITFDAAADWNTVDGQRVDEIFGEDADGNPIHEQLVRANGAGAVTVTTLQCFSRVIRIDMQASLAGAGTATIGVGTKVEYGKLDFAGFVIYDSMAEPPATTGYDFNANVPVAILEGSGVIDALPEDAVTVGEPVFMRVVAGAGVLWRGRLTGLAQADDANWARVLGAYWDSASAGGTVPAKVRFVR